MPTALGKEMSGAAPSTLQVRLPPALQKTAGELASTEVGRSFRQKTSGTINRFLLPEWLADPELARRGRFIVRFGFLGLIFGLSYAAFYLAIGHYWGSGIVLVCSLGFGTTPWFMHTTRHLAWGGNGLAAIMTAGFTALCCCEGGVEGHAVAWLAAVPLCSLLLVDWKAARFWVVICFCVGAVMVAADIAQVKVPITYDMAWHPIIRSSGYLGLIAFMFALGLTFENGRRHAFAKMQAALKEVAASNEQLVVLNREKTEFLGIAAHDLRNPLTTIISYAQFLEGGATKDEVSKIGKTVFAAGTRMRDLIKNLLDANKIDQGKLNLEIKRCSLDEVITESVTHNELNAERKGISIKVNKAPGIFVRADQTAIIQVLDNLISNAVKYSPFNLTVIVEARSEESIARVSVTDQGPGISEADQKKMFGRFARLSAQPTGGESSIGLGLSIVKKLIETLSGSVQCQSTLGNGSTFSITLPVWKDEEWQ